MDTRRVNILLIEDNHEDATIIKQQLAAASDASNYELEWVDQLDLALEKIRTQRYDIVLTDLHLPDSEGIVTLETLRAQAPEMPIVVLTSSDDEALAVQALQKGAQDYLVKAYIQVYRNLMIRAIRYAIERRRAQHELLRLASFPEQSPNPIIEMDLTGLVTYLNPAARSQFPALVTASPSHPVLDGLRELVEAGRRDGRLIWRRETISGSRIYEQHISFYPETSLIRSYLIDITERKQVEEKEKELSAAAAAAAQAERRRAIELDKAYQQVKTTQAMLVQAEKMGAVGQLASGIAHEVKNPLGMILQGVSLLEPEIGKDNKQNHEILAIMKDAVKRADRIVRGLLDFAKPGQLVLRPFSIDTVIKESMNLVEKQLAVKDIKIVNEISPDLPPVLIDENQIKQVFINLILNAFQAMPSGGQLTIRAYTKILDEVGDRIGRRVIDIFRSRERVLICEIRDTGAGIPKEILTKVFDPFFTTKPPGEGTGLGLSITRTIVEGHRGLIGLESEEGKGTTVILMLPLAETTGTTGRLKAGATT